MVPFGWMIPAAPPKAVGRDGQRPKNRAHKKAQRQARRRQHATGRRR